MAIMIPESIENLDGVTTGEIRVFKLLRDLLPDDYYVWYDVLLQNKYPDFIILGPDLGIVVIEVKDWEMGSIINANADHFELRTTGRRPENPLNQAKTYMRALLDILKTQEELKENQGKYKGNLSFNYGHGVILPKIYSREFEEKNFKNVLPQDFVMYKDALDHLSNTRDRGDMLERLRHMIPSGSNFTKLSKQQVEIIKSMLSRESVPEGEKAELTYDGGTTKGPNKSYESSPAKHEQAKREYTGLHYFMVASIIIVVATLGWLFSTRETNREIISNNMTSIAIQKDELKNVPAVVPPQTKAKADQVRDKKKPAAPTPESKKPKAVAPTDKVSDVNKDQVSVLPQKITLPKIHNNLNNREGIWIKGNINPKGEKIYHLPKEKFYSQTKPETWFKTEQDAINAGYRKAKDFWIKGNIGRNGEKIYHMPGQKYYDKTRAEEWFKTEEEAESAGYRKSKI